MPGWTSYSFFLGMAAKSTAVLAGAALVSCLLRTRSAAIRHLVWSAALAAILALPLLALSLPALRVPIAGSLLGPGFSFEANSSVPSASSAPSTATRPAVDSTNADHPLPDWHSWLIFVWAAGTAFSFAQMFIGWAAVRRLQRRATSLTGLDLGPLTRSLDMKEEVNVLEVPPGSMPISFGLFHATILLPPEIVGGSAERRRMVLLHELAHVRRGDGAMQLLARTALALYWWNPLAWIAWREFLKERERAADDLVLGAGACASEYAAHLLDIARSMQSSATAFAVPMARRSQLEGRLLAILNSQVDRRTSVRLSPITASLLAIGLIAPLAAVHAQGERTQTAISTPADSSSFAGIMWSGNTAPEQRQYDEAKALYTRALNAAKNASETANALIHLGTVELAKKNAAQALEDFERAQKTDSEQTAEADMWMAIAQEDQNNLEAADGLFRTALAAADPNSAAAATTMELYALLLRQEGKQDEANKVQVQADAVRNAEQARAQATSQVSSADVYKIGGDVKTPVPVSKVEPSYTEEARLAKYQGTVLLAVVIDASGLPRDIKIVRGLGFGLSEKAIDAVTKWKFTPATKDGQPVAVSAQIEVNFRLL